MQERLIIEVDENDRKIGLRPRNDFYGGKYIHRASHLILFNPSGEILLQKRADTKRWYPNLYEYSVSGTVENESYQRCIEREIPEELGIQIPVTMVLKYFTLDKGVDKAWRSVFVGETNEQLKPNEEIESLDWFSLEELERDIIENPQSFTPHLIKGLENKKLKRFLRSF